MNQDILEVIILRAKEISRKWKLSLSLDEVIPKILNSLQEEHSEALVKDIDHGFFHTLMVVEYALKIAEKENFLEHRNNIALGALLHDLFGVKTEIFTRKDHDVEGSKFIKLELPKILNIRDQSFFNIETIEKAALYHGFDVIDFQNTIQKKESKEIFMIAAIVRDADTLDETINVERIYNVSETYNRPLFFETISDLTRLAVLLTETSEIVARLENDTMMFLLRNVTKGLDEGHYVTKGAQSFLLEGLLEKNTKGILDGVDRYNDLHPKDITDKAKIKKLLDRMIKLYNEYKDKNLIIHAKIIVSKFTQQGVSYFNQNISVLEKELIDLQVKTS